MRSSLFDKRSIHSIITLALSVFTVAGAWALSERQVSRNFDAVEPAVCLVSYSAEVRNPSSGESSRRNTRALGLVVSPNGLVMTHGHMKRQDYEPFNIRVEIGKGDDTKSYDAKLLRKPDDVNVCFLQIETKETLNLSFAKLSERSLSLGDEIMIVGMLGESMDYSRAAMLRRIGSVLEKPRRTYCIDERVPFEAVGGPVMNAAGDVVGIVGFDLSAREGGDLYVRSGHPLIYQSKLLKDYIANPETERDQKDDAWLGVFTQPLTDDMAEYWGLPQEGGVIVASLVPGSPAVSAGFQRGDVITEFNGAPIRARQNQEVLGFTKLVRETGVGQDVEVDFYRDGEPMTIGLTLAGRPKSASDAGEFESETFGITVRELTQDVRILLNLSEDTRGVIVRRVKPGSWAFLGGMRPGVIIMGLGGHPVTTIEEFRAAVAKVEEEKPQEVSVFCRVGSRTRFFRLEPRWDGASETP
jgi:serine protease Do